MIIYLVLYKYHFYIKNLIINQTMDFIVDETSQVVEQPEDITIQLKPTSIGNDTSNDGFRKSRKEQNQYK